MDKRIIFAVAGSGKTTAIVSGLDLARRVLLVTYTANNYSTLRHKIFERFGFFPANIKLLTYFAFAYSFCLRPLLAMPMRTKGIIFTQPPARTLNMNRNNDFFYLDRHRRLYHSRIVKLMQTKGVLGEAIERVEKYFDVVCFDEAQDVGGHDFTLLEALCRARIDIRFVGDFYQHTFTTSHDGKINQNLHADFEMYKRRFEEAGLTVDTTSLTSSHRCSASVSQFIRENIGIAMRSHSDRTTEVALVAEQAEADKLYTCEKTVKLFYDEHTRYGCHSQNWGASKGQDHHVDVCVVLNQKTHKAYLDSKLRELSPLTKNRLYVACSRARGNLYLAPESLFKKYKL